VNTPVQKGALARLGRACALHPWRTIAVWAAIVVAVVGSSAAFGGRLVNEMTIPGSETQQAADLLKERFPANAGDAATVVFNSADGLNSEKARDGVAAARAAAAKIPHVVSVGDAYAGKGGGISKNGEIGFIDVRFDSQAAEVEQKDVDQLEEDVSAVVEPSGLEVEYGGDVVNAMPKETGSSEIIGLAAAVVVLLLVLGTAVAMSLPIVLALVSVLIGVSGLSIAAIFTSLNTVTPTLAVMLGLGVGIDYALFIVTRFRQALATGASPADAATTAVATAGRAVVFAGATVAISISGLMVIGLSFVTKLGLGAASAVVVSVAAAVTLLPALLGKLGNRVNRLRIPTFVTQDDADELAHERSWVNRWGKVVTRHPRTSIAVALAALLTLAVPIASLELGSSDASTHAKHTTTRKAYDLLSEGFGPGLNGPLKVAIDQKDDRSAANKVAAAFKSTPGVAAVAPPVTNDNGDAAVVIVYPTTKPQATETADLVDRLRDETVPQTLRGSSAHAYVGGQTAAYGDIATRMLERMPYFLLLVGGIIFFVLTMAFRSVVVAVKAAFATLLSGIAAIGAVVAVFQEGWGSSLVGLDRTGPIESYMPMILFAILFGLSMDYEVFLVSRIREAYTHGASARRAITDGIGAIGKVIVAAGTIMVVVFLSFVLGDDRVIKEFGLGLAVAILMDAFVVRMLLVPAVMHLLGDHAWYMPRWLDRALPHLTIEPPEAEPETGEESDLPKAA
jgi:putative drug exporter of the RND superfamily